MKKRDNITRNFIKKELGIDISDLLENRIQNPSKVETDNYDVVKELAIEFLPIYNRYRYTLDGPFELHKIIWFGELLTSKIRNKPELLELYEREPF